MNGVPILLYHRINDVSPDRDPLGLAVSPARFIEQMDYLHKRNYHCLSLGDIVEANLSGRRLPRRSVVITFDDGSLDIYEQVFPVFQHYNFTATVFLVADRTGGLTDWEGQAGDYAFPLLSWEEIREMARHGIQFGSHTRTHPRLGSLGAEQATWEICSSKQAIEEGLGGPVEFFAYPYARLTVELQRVVKQCGYLGAWGSTDLPETSFNLWRAELFAHDSLLSFRFKLSDWWRPFVKLKKQTRPVRHLGRRVFGKL